MRQHTLLSDVACIRNEEAASRCFVRLQNCAWSCTALGNTGTGWRTLPAVVVKRPELIEWMNLHSSDLFLSTVTIAEIADGIAKAKREGAKRKATVASGSRVRQLLAAWRSVS